MEDVEPNVQRHVKTLQKKLKADLYPLLIKMKG